MPGKLDEISRLLGSIETSIGELARRAGEDRTQRDHEHRENQKGIAGVRDALEDRSRKFDEFAKRTDKRISALELLPSGGLQMTRTRMAILASIGLGVVVLTGWVIQAGISYAVQWAAKLLVSHWH